MIIEIISTIVLCVFGKYVINWYRQHQEQLPEKSLFDFQKLDEGKSIEVDEDNIINKMKKTGQTMLIVYGSQTGTAEGFAYQLKKMGRKRSIFALCEDSEEIDFDDLAKAKEIDNFSLIFLVATYGEGDPTDNAIEMCEWFQNVSDDDETLKDIKFAVFGCGNSTYEHFNKIGRLIDRRCEELGGNRIVVRGESDDSRNADEDFMNWATDIFWPNYFEHCDMIIPSTSDEQWKEYKLKYISDDVQKVFRGEPHKFGSYENQKGAYGQKNPLLAEISKKYELFSKDSDRSCLHLELSLINSKLRYETGDHVAILPENDPVLVERLGELLSINLNDIITMDSTEASSTKKHPFPCPSSFRTLFTHYLDITTPLKQSTISELQSYGIDENDKLLLKELCDRKNRSKYNKFILDARRTLIAILEDIPSWRPSIDHLLESLPRLQCRYYSISSSSKKFRESVHLTAICVEYQTKSERTNFGVCTSYLNRLKEGDHIPIYIRRSKFKLPIQIKVPLILVGPGTGIAPFRAFLQERQMQKSQGKPIGDIILFYGCRNKEKDYLYRNEIEEYVNDGTIKQLFVAFSRDQSEKVYVQDLIRQNGSLVFNMFENKASLFICGDAMNMAREVHQTLLDVFKTEGEMDISEANSYMQRLNSLHKYSSDVWS
ncbi:hypothetical protein SNEBB_003083 [Seison nebaliae]|nr:hypothetical protein SNEBB_003083 [Seison nebaliae]